MIFIDGTKIVGLSQGKTKAQSAMEYLMTYGWAILVIAIIVSLLFALGVFNGLFGTPNLCTPQPGFTCVNPIYGVNGISATISQTSGSYYTGAWAFIVSSSEHIGSSGLPQNFSTTSTSNMVYIGELSPGKTVAVQFTNTTAGDIPTANIPVGYPFTGYIWLGYCTIPGCASPAYYSKVAVISAAQSGATFTGVLSGSTTTTTTIGGSTTTTSIQSYYLTEVSSPFGGGTASPGTGLYTFGSNVVIQETPAGGYTFTGWTCSGTGCYSGSATNTVITITSNVAEVANFETFYYLTMSVAPSSSGSVFPQSGSYTPGSVVHIYETSPASGYGFANWTCAGSGCYSGPLSSTSITIPSGPVTETANFVPITYNPTSYSGSGDVVFTSSTTLSGNINTGASVTIDSGVTLTTDGYSIIAGESFNNSGTIHTNGAGNGAGSGGCCGAGQSGSGSSSSYGGSGGGGGSGYSGDGSFNGGNGGSTRAGGGDGGCCNGGSGSPGSTPSAPVLSSSTISSWYNSGIQGYLSGAGGGGGASGYGCGTHPGGAGGYGIYIQANQVLASGGIINASGLPGGNGCNDGDGTGGGGGGGVILIAYGNAGYSTQSYISNAGAAGTSGYSGASGGNGQYLAFPYNSVPPITPA